MPRTAADHTFTKCIHGVPAAQQCFQCEENAIAMKREVVARHTKSIDASAIARELVKALGKASTFIHQPLRMTPEQATYSVRNYNALTAQIRAALAQAEAAGIKSEPTSDEWRRGSGIRDTEAS